MVTMTIREACAMPCRGMRRDLTCSSWARRLREYQGAYKVTRGCCRSLRQRVIDTPITEHGFPASALALDVSLKPIRRIHDLQLRDEG